MLEHLRVPLARLRNWLIPVALLALAPKCALCVLAYAGAGAALGLSGPEICGSLDVTAGHRISWLLAPILAISLAVAGLIGRSRQ